jgi:hypothetical protein
MSVIKDRRSIHDPGYGAGANAEVLGVNVESLQIEGPTKAAGRLNEMIDAHSAKNVHKNVKGIA